MVGILGRECGTVVADETESVRTFIVFGEMVGFNDKLYGNRKKRLF